MGFIPPFLKGVPERRGISYLYKILKSLPLTGTPFTKGRIQRKCISPNYMRHMTRKKFEQLVADGFARLPEQFRAQIKNVGFLVEDEPSAAVRKEVMLRGDETLLGFYRGIPRTARGGEYGMGPTLPDAIIIYQKPTEEEAKTFLAECSPDASHDAFREAVRQVVADTVWHEVAHYFGFDEEAVAQKEKKRRFE